jgi:hypothetical protein
LNPTAAALLEAHMKHELAQFSNERIESSLRGEIEFIYDYAAARTVQDLLPRASVTEWILEELRQAQASPDTLQFLSTASDRLIQAAIASPEKIGDLVRKEDHERAVDILIESSQMREDMSRDFARSMFFRRLISEVLFFSIKRFLGEDNILAKSIPGVSSLFKFGQNLVNQAMPNLDENMTRVIKDFIGKNMDSVVRYTETVLTGQMDDKLIRELADSFWEDIEKRPISQIASDTRQVPNARIQDASNSFWNHLRGSDFARRIVRTALDAWFDFYGTRQIGKVLDEAGWPRDRIVEGALKAALPAFTDARDSGSLEKILRRRLEGFYSSPEAQAALG